MFSTLSDLTALLKKDQVAEAKDAARDPAADFDGIKSVVSDNFADLEDNLGKSGKLMSLLKSTGVDKLDTSKDDAGKTMTDRLVAAMVMVAKAKKDIMSVMDEMEVMVASAAPAKKVDESLNEAKEYDDSSEFTDELHKVGQKVLELKAIVRQPRWMHWMRVTDQNFDTSCVSLNEDMHTKLVELDKAYDALEGELLNAA